MILTQQSLRVVKCYKYFISEGQDPQEVLESVQDMKLLQSARRAAKKGHLTDVDDVIEKMQTRDPKLGELFQNAF